MLDLRAIERNIWKFYLYKFLRGLWIPATIWMLYLLARGFSYSQIGIGEVVTATVLLLCDIPLGAFADLIGRKQSVFFGYAIFGITIFLLGLCRDYPLFLVIVAAHGLGQALFSGADNALLYDSLKVLGKENQYSRIDGRSNAYFSLGSVLGGFLGVYLYTQNISLPFFVGGIIFVLVGATFLLMEEPNPVERAYTLKSHYTQITDGITYARDRSPVRWIIAFSSIVAALFSYQIFIVSPSLVSIGFDVQAFGVLFTLIWGLEGIMYWNAHKILSRLGEKGTLFLIVMCHMLCFLLLGMIDTRIALIFIIINYLGRGIFYPVTNNYAQKHIATRYRATVLSVQNFAMTLLGIVTIFIFSRLTDTFSINAVYLICGVSAFAAAVLLFATYPEDSIRTEERLN
jgi:MFS family permease